MSKTHSPISSPSWRVLKKDGTLNIHRAFDRMPLSDLYHFLLSLSWPIFFAFVVLGYISINLFFAILYYLCGPQALEGLHVTSATDRFLDCFFFSVQTIATIGYGRISPSGLIPNLLMTVQALLGMLTLAVVTGLLFARFARPTARVIFSNNAILGPYNGKKSFFFRAANERLNQIVEAHMTLTLVKNETTKEGERFRKLYTLKLDRDYSPVFAMTWTVVHIIDEHSPLFKMEEKDLKEGEVEILASLTGMDDTFSQTIYSHTSYTIDDIFFNTRFKDILSRRSDGKLFVNLKGIHDVCEE